MGKSDIEFGTSTKEDFLYWITERHEIYCRKETGAPRPWTQDPILHEYKFTNAFRQLDKGTVALNVMLGQGRTSDVSTQMLDAFNIFWYRMFNRYEHATDIGYVLTWDQLRYWMLRLEAEGNRIFTSAHMTVGRANERKIITMLNSLRTIWNVLGTGFISELKDCSTLEEMFVSIKKAKFYGVGPFINYEIVTDLRWTGIGRNASDKLTWANIGPGCKRGLDRLGMHNDVIALQNLWRYVRDNCQPLIGIHFAEHCIDTSGEPCYPPFELREIEHSLCEFDKYERARTGVGRPREKYRA